MTLPLSVLADGNLKVLWVPAIVVPTAPTVAELTAVGVIDLSCYIGEGGYNRSTDEAVVTDNRLCSTSDKDRPGRFKDSAEITYVYQPQLPLAADNKAYATLVRGATGFIVERWGKLFSLAVVAADVVDVYNAEAGQQKKGAVEVNTVLLVMQQLMLSSRRQGVVVVA